MKSGYSASLTICAVLALGTATVPQAHAAADASTAASAVSAMPLASVVLGTSAVAGAVVVAPVALSTAGAVLSVKAVQVSARGTVYLLERVSDGARVSIEVAGKAASAVPVVASTVVTVSIIGAGTILSVAGEVIAFVPNTVGKALLHNEKVTK
jgi:hypothetical protein